MKFLSWRKVVYNVRHPCSVVDHQTATELNLRLQLFLGEDKGDIEIFFKP